MEKLNIAFDYADIEEIPLQKYSQEAFLYKKNLFKFHCI